MPSSRAPRHVAALLAVAVAAAAVTTLSAVPAAVSAATAAAPVRVIIELTGPSAVGVVGADAVKAFRAAPQGARSAFPAGYRAAVATVRAAQNATLATARAAGVAVTDTAPVTGVLNAVVATVPADGLAALRAQPGVARVTADEPVHALAEDNIPSTGAPEVWGRTDASGTALRGDGVTVAVIDTGIDYTLADLGGGFGAGHRVVAGHDYVNNDDDPMDDNAHGTHVAGIIAAGGQHLTGMAPDVTLTAYKALDADGNGELSTILLALDAATDPSGAHPADVVNMSLGGVGDGTDPLGRAATAAVAAGTVVVAAAGNAGPDEQSIGTPAAAPGVIAVGASITGVQSPTLTLHAGGTDRALDVTRFPISANPPAAPFTARLVDVGDGFDEDYAAAGDVAGAIVVYRTEVVDSLGEVLGQHVAQAQLAEQHGAIGAIVYQPSSTDPGQAPIDGGGGVFGLGGSATAPQARQLAETDWDLRQRDFVMMTVSSGDYQSFKDQLAAGTVTATIGSVDETDRIADFSSRGPGDAMTLKPEIVAPGFEILSDIPSSFGVEGDQYRFSGTSMAAPHVAGAAALLAQAHPDDSAQQLREALIGSARQLDSSAADASPSVQGAGALDIAAAIDQSVTATPDAVSFGLADMGASSARSTPLSVHNSGAAAVTVDLTVHASAAGTGSAAISPSTLTVPAHGSATATLTATPRTAGGDTETSGVVIGSIAGTPVLRVPYAQYVRALVVQPTPDSAAGSAQVFVRVPSAQVGAPALTALAPSGSTATVALTADAGGNGWYRGTLALTEGGVYRLDARAAVGDRALTGAAVVRSLTGVQQGSWQQVGITGQAGSLAVSPKAGGTAIAMSDDSVYPFFTTDRGASWTRTRSMPVAAGWGIPVADDRTAGAFWIALNGRYGQVTMDSGYQGRIVHTPDAGRTWQVLSFPDVAISAFAAHGATLAAVVDDGVYLSRDAGTSWTHIDHVWTDAVDTALFAGDDLLVQDYWRVWRVAGAATGSTAITSFMPSGDPGLQDLATDGATAYTADWNDVVYRSTDGGASWSRAGTNPLGYLTTFAAAQGSLYLGGVTEIATSQDGGAHFTVMPTPDTHALLEDLDRWPGSSDSSLLVSEGIAGVYATDDGTRWTRTGVSGTSVTDVAVGTDAAGTPVLLAGDDEGVHSRALTALDSRNQLWDPTGNTGAIGKASWQIAQSPLGAHAVWSLGGDGNGLGFIARQLPGEDLERVGPGGFTALALAVSPTAEQTVVVGYKSTPHDTGLLVTQDGFATWRSYASGLLIRQIRFDPRDPQRLWLATDSGLYRSDDLGATLVRLSSTAAATVWIDPARPAHLLVGGDGGVRRSDDGGLTFTAVQGTEMTSVDALVSAGSVLIAGTTEWHPFGLTVNGSGVFVSTDGGSHWRSASGGLTALSVLSLAVSGDGGTVFAGTLQGGVFRTPTALLSPPSPPIKGSKPSTAR